MGVDACVVGNLIASRSALACLLSVARAVYWLTEQPGSSVLPYMAEMRWLVEKPSRLSLADGFRVRLCLGLKLYGLHPWFSYLYMHPSWMGIFGGATLKRSMLLGTALLAMHAI